MFDFWKNKSDSGAVHPPSEQVDLKRAAAQVLSAAFSLITSAFEPDGFGLVLSEHTSEFEENVLVEIAKQAGDATFVIRLESSPEICFADPSVVPSGALLQQLRGNSELHEILRFGKVSFSIAARIQSIALEQWRERQGTPRRAGFVTFLAGCQGRTFNLAGRKNRDRRIQEAIGLIRGALPAFERFLDPPLIAEDLACGRRHGMDDRDMLEYAVCFGSREQARQAFQRRYEELLVPPSEYDEGSIAIRQRVGMPPLFDTKAPARFVVAAIELGLINIAEAQALPTFRDKWQ